MGKILERGCALPVCQQHENTELGAAAEGQSEGPMGFGAPSSSASLQSLCLGVPVTVTRKHGLD